MSPSHSVSRLLPLMIAVPLLAPQVPVRAAEVVTAGDSWAEFGSNELGEIFALNGHPEITVTNGGIGGTTADLWATNYLYLPYLVTDNPDAEWVWLSLGGNDMFAYYSSGQGATASSSIEQDLRTVLDWLFVYHPRIQVVMFGYDFVNFEQSPECWAQAAVYFPGMLTPDINQAFLQDIGAMLSGLAQDYPNLTYVDLWGTLQVAGGVPGAPNVYLPSPAEYMADCIHANDTGYRLIMQALYDGYFADELSQGSGCSSSPGASRPSLSGLAGLGAAWALTARRKRNDRRDGGQR